VVLVLCWVGPDGCFFFQVVKKIEITIGDSFSWMVLFFHEQLC